MSNRISNNIEIDFAYPSCPPKTVFAKQNDTGRRIYISMLCKGEPYIPEAGSTAKFRALKPDGKSVYYNGTISQSGGSNTNQVTVTFNQQALAVEGITRADLSIIDSGGVIVSTASFNIDVQKAPIGEQIDSKNEIWLTLTTGEEAVTERYLATDSVSTDKIQDGAVTDQKIVSISNSKVTQDSTHRFVTDTEKSTWDGKANTSDIPTNNNQLTNGAGYQNYDEVYNTASNLISANQIIATYSKINEEWVCDKTFDYLESAIRANKEVVAITSDTLNGVSYQSRYSLQHHVNGSMIMFLNVGSLQRTTDSLSAKIITHLKATGSEPIVITDVNVNDIGATVESCDYPFEISDSNGNTIFRIDENGNIATTTFNSKNSAAIPKTNVAGKVLTSTSTEGVYQWGTPVNIPETNVAGKVLTSTDTAGVYQWSTPVPEKTLKVPWLVDYHRGYSSNTVAENTMAAFKRAWLVGADSIETDARLAADGVYVCCHDDSITVNGTTYVIAQTNSSVLTNLVLSTDTEYGECKIPTTEEALKFCAHAGLICNLDIKDVNPDVQAIATLVNKCGMSGNVIYGNITKSNDNPLTVIDIAKNLLNYDKHAMFLFAAKYLTTWINGFADKTEVLERSWCWDYTYNATEHPERIVDAHAAGVKYSITSISQNTKGILSTFQPDCFEFHTATDYRPICAEYLDGLGF